MPPKYSQLKVEEQKIEICKHSTYVNKQLFVLTVDLTIYEKT